MKEIKRKLQDTKHEINILNEKLLLSIQKLNARSTRNFNKRIKMQENNVKNFKPIFYYQKDQIGILENENVKIN